MTPYWFGNKRIGWGLRPVSWRGWALTALYVVVALVLGLTLAPHQTTWFVVALCALTAAFIAVAMLTRG